MPSKAPGGKELLLDIAMSYDGNGNIVSKGNASRLEQYEYDAMNRLTQVKSGNTMECYHYDLAGNRVRRESYMQENQTANHMLAREEYNYNTRNQLQERKQYHEDILQSTYQYRYDKQGNLVEERNLRDTDQLTTTYGYDSFDRMNQVTLPDHKIQKNHYVSDHLGSIHFILS